MDAIDSLIGGSRRAQAVVDTAARELARADLPIAPAASTNELAGAPLRNHEVDVAGQLVTMTCAADVHHVTTAALRSAFSLYRDSLGLIRPAVPADPGGLEA